MIHSNAKMLSKPVAAAAIQNATAATAPTIKRVRVNTSGD